MRVLAPTVAVLLATAPAASAGGVYAGWIGTPDAGNAMVVQTDPAGAHVRTVTVSFDADCADGRYFAFHRRVALARGVLRASRNAHGRFAARYRTRVRHDGLVFAKDARLRGRFATYTARGTLTMRIRVLDPDSGELQTTCTARRLAWHLQRGRGRVFGGTTDQGEAVVMTLNRTREFVDEIAFGWHGRCSDGDGLDVPWYLRGLQLFGGVFADSRVYVGEDGESLGVNVSGRVRGPVVRGRLSVALMEASGDLCLARAARWVARSG